MPSPKHPTPRVFAHTLRAEWGRAVISEQLPDRCTFVFENVGVRTFMNASPVIIEVDVPQDERDALAAALIRPSGAIAPLKKKKAASAKKAKAAKADKAEKAATAAS
jgi:hypothetical protein